MQKENDAELKSLDAAVEDAVRQNFDFPFFFQKNINAFFPFSKPTLATVKCAKRC
jgi:hypothetical protein